MYPTKADFDNAVKQHWHGRSCLVAQCMKRLNLLHETSDADAVEDFAEQHGLGDLMGMFDKHFDNPGDESKAELVAIREELPSA